MIKLEEDRKRLIEAINTTFGNLVRPWLAGVTNGLLRVGLFTWDP